ncbi:YopX family protein [Enterococcus hirae]
MTPKFRAWDKKTETIQEVESISFKEKKLVIGQGNVAWFNSDYIINFDDIELMQSTGLKDKNGVEIFEGDIVAVENHPFQRKEDSSAGMEIEGDYAVGWNQHDLTWCAGDLLLARLKPYVRVIGNIYENHELLEEVKE